MNGEEMEASAWPKRPSNEKEITEAIEGVADGEINTAGQAGSGISEPSGCRR
jgi:hypothetical protein